ncbi:unnamed protein product [Heligmosomoides polygyrus]|uniref:Uncharacterized protein n=1 Tax=Heligmosomoides polygyrus TaxID=6339 RepID=A0A183FL75_HELPZ|nr:unnamed protein product [Heligmosomoides polygyrus]
MPRLLYSNAMDLSSIGKQIQRPPLAGDLKNTNRIPARIHTSPRPTNANALAQHSQTPPACQPASPSSSLVVPVSWEKELPAEMPGYRGTR